MHTRICGERSPEQPENPQSMVRVFAVRLQNHQIVTRRLTYNRTGLKELKCRHAAVTRCVLPGPRTSIVRGNCIRETSVKTRNKIVQEITRNVANVFSFYTIIAIEHGFSMHQHSPGP